MQKVISKGKLDKPLFQVLQQTSTFQTFQIKKNINLIFLVKFGLFVVWSLEVIRTGGPATKKPSKLPVGGNTQT